MNESVFSTLPPLYRKPRTDMKTKLAILLYLTTLIGSTVVAGTQPDQNGNNYVVIGAFSIEENAKHYVDLARKFQLHATFDINPARHLYYVYILQTPDRTIAIEEARKVRSIQVYNDTWVFTGHLGSEVAGMVGHDVDPSTMANMNPPVVDQPEQPVVLQPAVEVSQDTALVITESVSTSAVVDDLPDDGISKKFYFKVFRSSNGQTLSGDVDVVDAEKQRKVGSYQANKLVAMKPANKSGDLALQCQVFGYRKIVHPINFVTPESLQGATIENGRITVPFEMVRLKKGDYSVMYNVYFFKDAAIMRPESKYEVNALLEMMKENPKYKIRIHGHTNGKAAGKIIFRGEDKDFFSLTDSKDGFGSAKKLSEERANVIRDFLISEGVSPERLLIKAWGGKKPIYEKDHAQAHANVRVEIEIVEE